MPPARRRQERHLRALPTPEPDPPPQPGEPVFSPGRLRAWRDRRKLSRPQLAHLTAISPVVIAAHETGTTQPSPDDHTALAAALQVTPRDLLGPAGVCDSWEYWGVICSHLPPMTDEQIATVGTVLRRIQRRHHGDGDQMPKAA